MLPDLDPMPPREGGLVPRIGAGLRLLRDPTAFFAGCRARHGDTFVVDAFGERALCVFSPAGIRNLWALPEAKASKGLADFFLLQHKVPADLFAGRRTRPHDLFARDDVERYLRNLEVAVRTELSELGDLGTFEAFAFTHRLGHRVGLACWGGLDPASSRFLDPLAASLDRLDSADSFVHPHRALRTVWSGKRAERRALETLERIFAEMLAAAGPPGDDLFGDIRRAWQDTPGEQGVRGIARDVVLVHMGSMSNLFAAMAWTLLHVLDDPDRVDAIRGGDLGGLESCAHEAIRLHQRSIVLRRVLAPVVLEDETRAYPVPAGWFLATTMAVTNTTALAGLETFDPARYPTPRFREGDALGAREEVTTFGHGRHSCPAQRFSILAIRHAVASLVRDFELEGGTGQARALRRQIGGVARADRACPVRYRRRVA